MTTFHYTAINKAGKREASTIDAVSLFAAGHLLKQQGLLPVQIEENRVGFFQNLIRNFGTISLKEKTVFIENLSVMIKSGLTAPRALKLIATQTKTPKFQRILFDIASNVESGKGLNESLAMYPKIFSFIFVSMIKVGEMSGSLEKSLEYLSVQLEREADLKSKVTSAMLYPAVIIGAMVIIGALMGIFVLPQLTSIFEQFEPGKLPITTRVVIWISKFMSGHATLIIIGMIALVGGSITLLKTNQGKRAVDWVLLRFFILGNIIKKINLARFARVLTSMMKSGISIVEGLQVAAESVGNVYYQDALHNAATTVRLGKPVTEALEAESRLFPFILVQMLQVGEETGTLENILEQLAQQYENEVDATMRNLSSIIEPILILVIGGIVAVLALALIAPIYSISQSIG